MLIKYNDRWHNKVTAWQTIDYTFNRGSIRRKKNGRGSEVTDTL